MVSIGQLPSNFEGGISRLSSLRGLLTLPPRHDPPRRAVYRPLCIPRQIHPFAQADLRIQLDYLLGRYSASGALPRSWSHALRVNLHMATSRLGPRRRWIDHRRSPVRHSHSPWLVYCGALIFRRLQKRSFEIVTTRSRDSARQSP